jgi:glutathione S-transferase
MKLIIASPSPYARKARVALLEKKIDFEEIIDIPWNKNTLTKDINPLGKIPVLLHDNHKPLFDSKLIVQYLDYYKPQPLMYPEKPEENISARLIETVADGVCDAIVLIFLENTRKEMFRSKDWIKRQEIKIFEGVKYLSDHLKDRNYFVGSSFNISDICVYSCLEYIDLRFYKFEWRSQFPNLEKYSMFHKDRQSFKKTKPIAQTIEPLED